MSYRNSRGRFRSELDHGYRSGGKHSRPLERPLETFRRASYTRESTSGSDFSRFERNESFDSRYSPDRRDRYRSSYGNEYKISYRNNSADRYVESYRNRYDSLDERDDLEREDFHRRKNVGYDKPSRSRGRARGRAGFTKGSKKIHRPTVSVWDCLSRNESCRVRR
ncbi:DBIRD complex subunit ZNF326 [Bombina bombina]|uniref:DBIRD complex subunit ZNF326 n=1 Tax=Bombina bombina TaxID=8345 RepID=UPI00235A677D|nr:DBIRD complex subunit ZNF326 [Bombina bombina]